MRMISKFICDMKALHGIIKINDIEDINDILYRIGSICEKYTDNFNKKWEKIESEE